MTDLALCCAVPYMAACVDVSRTVFRDRSLWSAMVIWSHCSRGTDVVIQGWGPKQQNCFVYRFSLIALMRGLRYSCGVFSHVCVSDYWPLQYRPSFVLRLHWSFIFSFKNSYLMYMYTDYCLKGGKRSM